MHVAELQPGMVLLLPRLQRVARLEWRIFVLVVREEFVKQLVVQGHLLLGHVGQDVLVTDVVESRDGIETPALLLVAQEGHCLRLSTLQGNEAK